VSKETYEKLMSYGAGQGDFWMSWGDFMWLVSEKLMMCGIDVCMLLFKYFYMITLTHWFVVCVCVCVRWHY